MTQPACGWTVTGICTNCVKISLTQKMRLPVPFLGKPEICPRHLAGSAPHISEGFQVKSWYDTHQSFEFVAFGTKLKTNLYQM